MLKPGRDERNAASYITYFGVATFFVIIQWEPKNAPKI